MAGGYPSRNFTFTIQADAEQSETWPLQPADECPIALPEGARYLVCQVESAPTTGQLHLQGFVVFEKNHRVHAVRELFPGAHIEIMRGKVADSEKYCTKEETRISGPWRLGEAPKQGRRTDWADVKELITQGTSRHDVYAQAPHLANCSRGVETLYQHFAPPPATIRNVRVCVLWGASGVGRSHRARTTYPDAYVITGKYYEGKSFDQYNDQCTLILDEWRQAEWPLTLMNSILDKWSLQLQCRYQNKYAAWTTVIVCTNEDPAAVYCRDPAFQRRIAGRTIECIAQDNPEINLMTF